MARVDVNFNELRSAFYSFMKHAPDASASKCCCLDALYAVECGISAVLLREKKETSTNFLKNITNHDINALIKLCKTPPTVQLPAQISLAKNRTISCHTIAAKDFHSALRYGVKIPDSEWQNCATILKKLSDWVIDNLERR